MRRVRAIGLLLEDVVFTIVVPGSIVFWLPRIILNSERLRWPVSWSWVQFLALIPLALGIAIYLRCVWEFAARGRGIPAPIDHPKQLVVTGLYRYVRNPMYLGCLLFLFGEALFFHYWAFFLYALGWLVFVHLNILFYEEPNLRRKFGSSYEQYTHAVGRWIPGRRYSGLNGRDSSNSPTD
jgi:protein-S-isoprenylcysteine O-methyltransferase Ste14